MTTPVLQFIADHPVTAFFIAWPIALVLVSWAWLAAAITENAMNLVLRLCTLVANTVVLLFRGYAPQAEPSQTDEPAE